MQKQAVYGQAGPDPAAMWTVAKHAQQLVTSALRCAIAQKARPTIGTKQPIDGPGLSSALMSHLIPSDQRACCVRRVTKGGKAGRAARLAAVKGAVTEKLRSIGEFATLNMLCSTSAAVAVSVITQHAHVCHCRQLPV